METRVSNKMRVKSRSEVNRGFSLYNSFSFYIQSRLFNLNIVEEVVEEKSPDEEKKE